MNIEPIGVLRKLSQAEQNSFVASAALEVAGGLSGIGEHSHALVTAWLEDGAAGRMATRVARIASRTDRQMLLAGLDWPEGTIILSVEGYSSTDHCIFSARDGEGAVYTGARDEARQLAALIKEAGAFHGETCAGVILGAKVIQHMTQTWQIGRQDPRLRLWVGSDGCISDALIALSGITLGTARLKVPGGRIYRFVLEDKGLAYFPTDEAFAPAAEVLAKDVADLFAIREEAQRSEERKPVHDKRPARRTKEEEALIERVSASLVEGKLSCAMAYKIADEMGVHILDVGRAADEAKVKISHCQLGCFR